MARKGTHKYNTRKIQHTNIRLDHHETSCKQRHLRRKIEIHMHGREIFLPDQPDGQGRINHDSDFKYTTGICGQI